MNAQDLERLNPGELRAALLFTTYLLYRDWITGAACGVAMAWLAGLLHGWGWPMAAALVVTVTLWPRLAYPAFTLAGSLWAALAKDGAR